MTTLRAAAVTDAGAIAQVLVRSWRSTYATILPSSFLAAMDPGQQTERWLRKLGGGGHGGFVACDAAKVVGFCEAGPNRDEPTVFRGEIYGIYLLEDAQRRGLGSGLMGLARTWLQDRGLAPVLVWVLRDNQGARRFYERLGGSLLWEKPVTIAGAQHVEVAYGWSEPRTTAP